MAGELDVYEAMRTTRAVRRLRPDPVPDDVLRRVLEAATWGPTGGNAQPWRVVVVKDAAKKKRLQELYLGPWRQYEAAHRELLAAMPERVRAAQERMMAAVDHQANNLHLAPVIVVFCFKPELLVITDAGLDRPSIVGGASVYPSVQNLLLACRREGLGCTLTTLLCTQESAVKELLEIPADWATAAAVPIGYPAGKGHGPVKRRAVEKMAFLDRWDAPL